MYTNDFVICSCGQKIHLTENVTSIKLSSLVCCKGWFAFWWTLTSHRALCHFKGIYRRLHDTTPPLHHVPPSTHTHTHTPWTIETIVMTSASSLMNGFHGNSHSSAMTVCHFLLTKNHSFTLSTCPFDSIERKNNSGIYFGRIWPQFSGMTSIKTYDMYYPKSDCEFYKDESELIDGFIHWYVTRSWVSMANQRSTRAESPKRLLMLSKKMAECWPQKTSAAMTVRSWVL